MGIFTALDPSEIAEFLKRYDVGGLIRSEGIAQGVENTNYFVEAGRGKFVLTIFEGRTELEALPFFLELMTFLSSRGFSCPAPVPATTGKVLSKIAEKPAALLTWLEGAPAKEPMPTDAYEAARALAVMHDLARKAPLQRQNDLGIEAFDRMLTAVADRFDEIGPGLGAQTARQLAVAKQFTLGDMPKGIIHGDLFPDNVLFSGGSVSGVIDFYFACSDYLAYDVAVMLCAWANRDGRVDAKMTAAILKGYQEVRMLDSSERDGLVHLMRIACLRFLLSRAQDLLNPRTDAVVTVKDPLEFGRLLDSLAGADESLIRELAHA